MFKGSYNDMRRSGAHIKNEGFRRSDEHRGGPRRPFNPSGPRRDDERRPFKPSGARRDDDPKVQRFGKERIYDRRDRQERENTGGDLKEREEFFHSSEFAKQVIKFRKPTLGKENERPIVKGRRNGWRRKGLDENGGGNTPEPTGEK